jgi:hypothetical protein
MAYIDNTQTKIEMNDAMRGNSVSNIAPTKIADTVQPVININPKDYRKTNLLKQTTKTNTGTSAIFTTDAIKETYITGVLLSWMSTVASDSTTAHVTCVQDGGIVYLQRLAKLTLTATTKDMFISFMNPVKVDKNTNVNLTLGFTVGAENAQTCVYGYTVDA